MEILRTPRKRDTVYQNPCSRHSKQQSCLSEKRSCTPPTQSQGSRDPLRGVGSNPQNKPNHASPLSKKFEISASLLQRSVSEQKQPVGSLGSSELFGSCCRHSLLHRRKAPSHRLQQSMNTILRSPRASSQENAAHLPNSTRLALLLSCGDSPA